jgi:hypothetical protein
MMTKFRDRLTYAELGGRRKARRYVVAAVTILTLAVGIFGWSWLQRVQARAEVAGTNQPALGLLASTPALEKNLVSPHMDNISPVSQNRDLAGDPNPAGVGASQSACPADPGLWRLLDVFPGINYKRIDPPCVYAGLSKTVAWYLMTRMGYSGAEAAGLLGFANLPQGPYLKVVRGMTAKKGPQGVPIFVEFFHPDLQYWSLTEKGGPGAAFSLRGCYRTHTLAGSQVKAWGSRYAVICTVAGDYDMTWGGFRFGSHAYFNQAVTEQVKRGFLLFGYISRNRWELIGQHKDLWAMIEPAKASQDREFYASRYGSGVWDANWLEDVYGFGVKTPPEDWRSYNDPAEIRAIADELNERRIP